MVESEMVEVIVCPAVEKNPRNSEADIIELKDGRLLLGYTEFYHGSGTDFSPARIAGKVSGDKGRTWSEPYTIQENVGAQNVMETDFLRLETGEIAFFFCVKNSEADCHPYMRKTYDEGETWTDMVPVAKFYPGYFCLNNDRAVQLSNHRILLPASYGTNVWINPTWVSLCFYSDDNGRTWFKGEEVRIPNVEADEPGVIELKDGRVMMWIRTDAGYIYRAYSEDKGETWSKPESMGLRSPSSPQTIKRIPSTDALLLVWNNTPGPRRVPLTAAVSYDDGETWVNLKNLETDERYTYAYTSITFVGEEALLTYWVSGGGISLKLRIIPVEWFSEMARGR